MGEKNILVNSVKKALDVLNILVFEDIFREGIGLFDMARKMNVKPNALHNLLKTMCTCGYVCQNENGKYAAGPIYQDMLHISRIASEKTVSDIIRPVLVDLSVEIDEIAVFTVLSHGSRVIVSKVEHNHPIKIVMSSIENQHLYEKPTGRILVAYTDNMGFELIKSKWGYPGELWGGIRNDADFQRYISEIREKGYEIRWEQEVVSAGVPVLGDGGFLLGALGAYSHVQRWDASKEKTVLVQLSKAAKEMGDLLSRSCNL